MTSKILNFEFFRLNSEESFIKHTTDIKAAADSGYKTVIGLLLADGFLYKHNDEWNSMYNRVVEYANSLGVTLKLLTGMSHDNAVNCETIPFNFYLHTVWKSYKDKELGTYNPHTGKFLFLGGVPDRLNRIGLLYQLYNRGLLRHAEWSFFTPWTTEQKNNSLQYFPTSTDYYNFVKFAERKIDNLYDSSKTYGTGEVPVGTAWTNDSAWIDPEIYSSTSLSLISEGHPGDDNNNSRFLTEKIYRVFVQGHPFLLAANPTIFNHIKELGFKTFEDYFPIKDYGVDYPEEKRLEKLIENLKYFLDNKIDFTQDVEYNRNHFFKLSEENAKILETLDADQSEIDFYFDRKGFGHLL
jgi:hypothetical protein